MSIAVSVSLLNPRFEPTDAQLGVLTRDAQKTAYNRRQQANTQLFTRLHEETLAARFGGHAHVLSHAHVTVESIKLW